MPKRKQAVSKSVKARMELHKMVQDDIQQYVEFTQKQVRMNNYSIIKKLLNIALIFNQRQMLSEFFPDTLGDGRKRAYTIPQRRPTNFRSASVKRIIEDFERTGFSNHSSNASTVQYVIDYCDQKHIPYRIWCTDRGFYIEKMKFVKNGLTPINRKVEKIHAR